MKSIGMPLGMLVVLASALHGQDEFNKERHHWMKYKAGSFVTFKLALKAGGQEFEGTMKQTMTEVNDKSYTLATSVDVAGQPNEESETEEIPAKSGEEAVKVGDKEFKCTIWTAKSKKGEKQTTTRVWLAADVKVPLKMEIKGEEGTGTMTAAALQEKATAGGKDYDCVRMEGDVPTDDGLAKAKFWMHPDVPGMVVKFELKIQAEQGEVEMSGELSGVEVK